MSYGPNKTIIARERLKNIRLIRPIGLNVPPSLQYQNSQHPKSNKAKSNNAKRPLAAKSCLHDCSWRWGVSHNYRW